MQLDHRIDVACGESLRAPARYGLTRPQTRAERRGHAAEGKASGTVGSAVASTIACSAVTVDWRGRGSVASLSLSLRRSLGFALGLRLRFRESAVSDNREQVRVREVASLVFQALTLPFLAFPLGGQALRLICNLRTPLADLGDVVAAAGTKSRRGAQRLRVQGSKRSRRPAVTAAGMAVTAELAAKPPPASLASARGGGRAERAAAFVHALFCRTSLMFGGHAACIATSSAAVIVASLHTRNCGKSGCSSGLSQIMPTWVM